MTVFAVILGTYRSIPAVRSDSERQTDPPGKKTNGRPGLGRTAVTVAAYSVFPSEQADIQREQNHVVGNLPDYNPDEVLIFILLIARNHKQT